MNGTLSPDILTACPVPGSVRFVHTHIWFCEAPLPPAPSATGSFITFIGMALTPVPCLGSQSRKTEKPEVGSQTGKLSQVSTVLTLKWIGCPRLREHFPPPTEPVAMGRGKGHSRLLAVWISTSSPELVEARTGGLFMFQKDSSCIARQPQNSPVCLGHQQGTKNLRDCSRC